MKAVLGLIVAAALIAPVQAAQMVAPRVAAGGSLILVEDGCGRDAHRNDRGECRPNFRQEERRMECPRGYHLGNDGRRCWPN